MSIIVSVLAFANNVVSAEQPIRNLEGFTEPDEIVEVASPYAGIVSTVTVERGQQIKEGQLIAELDTRVLKASLKVAKAKAASTSAVTEARALLELRKRRAELLRDLLDNGSANPEELLRAETEQTVAEAALKAAEDQIKIFLLEQKELETQIESRQIKSRMTGTIANVHRKPGEFVSASEPTLVTLVRLDVLRVKFFVPIPLAFELSENQRVAVILSGSKTKVPAKVDYISPLVDASSMTVRVEVTIDNLNGAYRSGLRCRLQTASSASSAVRLRSHGVTTGNKSR